MLFSDHLYLQEEDKIYLERQEAKWVEQTKADYRQRITDNMPQHFTTLEALEHLNTTKSWM